LNLEKYFAGYTESKNLFDALLNEIESLGQVEVKVTQSQVSFRLGVAFAWAWILENYLKGKSTPLVLI
jgi:hypothetical protein